MILSFCFVLGYSQTITLNFNAIDSITQSSISLDSVKIENLTLGCDTTVTGTNGTIYPVVIMTNVGMLEDISTNYQYFKVNQNVPNPFNGKTIVKTYIPSNGKLNISLLDVTGKCLTTFDNNISLGFNDFDVTSNVSGVLLLKFSKDGISKTIKIINLFSNFYVNEINHININNSKLKSSSVFSGNLFNFYVGNQLQYTASSSGYHDEIIIDSPTVNTTYTFIMTDTARSATVITSNITNITYNSATGGGTVVSDGGADVTSRGVCWNISINPTTDNNHTSDGTGVGSFVSYISGLNYNTVYHVRAYATNRIETSYGDDITFTTSQSYCDGISVVDYGGQNYNTIEIGTQCWLKENLNVGNVVNSSTTQTDNNIVEKYCYNNNSINCDIYGGLYQWNEVMNYTTLQNQSVRGICPTGWHMPSSSDWNQLGDYVGGQSVAGGPLKKEGYVRWDYPNVGATNSSNFTGFGGGRFSATFDGLKSIGWFWTSDRNITDTIYSYIRQLSKDDFALTYITDFNWRALSVRCVLGNGIDRADVTTNDVVNITDTTAICHGYVNADGGSSVTSRGMCWNTSINPTTINNHTTDGNGLGAFTSNLTGLTQNVTYYVRAYAINAAGIDYGDNIEFTTPPHDPCGGLTSIILDGKTYNLVQIGNQCWFKENLDRGTMINVSANQTNNGVTEKYCYDNNPTNCNTYGGLYQWDEMMNYSTTQGSQGLCPIGWHIPTNSDWTMLMNYLGGSTVAGGKMKEMGTGHWNYPNTGATNESEFTGLPGGYSIYPSYYYNINMSGVFYSSTPIYVMDLEYNSEGAFIGNSPNGTSGYSIRCVKY